MPNLATTVPLPLPGPADVKRWMTEVNTARGPGYASAVSISLAHYRLQGQADARRELAKVFANAHDRMSVITLPFIRKIAEETARVFGGDGETFDLLDPRSGDPVDGWAQVVEDTNLRAKLKIINRLTRVARRTFVRVTWDAAQERVRITTWTPDAIWPRFAPDSYDLDSCHGVLLRLSDVIDAKGKPQKRWEFWSPTQNFIVNEIGETWVAEESGGKNPYRYDDGTPVVPIVSFGDEDDDAGYWLSPRQDWIDSQRALNVGESSRLHLSNVAGYGQWVAERNEDGQANDWEDEVETGPDGLVKVPRGWTLQNKFAQADFKGLGDEGERHLRVATSLNGLPPGSVIGDARQAPSGSALLLERRPLDELRTDQTANYREPVQRLLELVRIVHNHHCADGAEMIGVPRWVPGSAGLPPDPESQRRIREADVRLGVASPVTILMEDRGIPRAEAEKLAGECAADNAKRNTMTAIGARLVMGGAVVPTEPAGAPVVADEPEATVDDGTGPILGPDGEPVNFFMYEMDGGTVTINEMRRAKGLRPDPRFGTMTLPEYKAANREMYATATTTTTGGSAEKITGLAEPVKA